MYDCMIIDGRMKFWNSLWRGANNEFLANYLDRLYVKIVKKCMFVKYYWLLIRLYLECIEWTSSLFEFDTAKYKSLKPFSNILFDIINMIVEVGMEMRLGGDEMEIAVFSFF